MPAAPGSGAAGGDGAVGGELHKLSERPRDPACRPSPGCFLASLRVGKPREELERRDASKADIAD